jgi:hypothetical protein
MWRGGSAVNISARKSWDSEQLQPKKGPGDLREKRKRQQEYQYIAAKLEK